ncbi:hypothetical protein M432DRAFT_239472 [Thermoascus aurantiacus ATCC 26904]
MQLSNTFTVSLLSQRIVATTATTRLIVYLKELSERYQLGSGSSLERGTGLQRPSDNISTVSDLCQQLSTLGLVTEPAGGLEALSFGPFTLE